MKYLLFDLLDKGVKHIHILLLVTSLVFFSRQTFAQTDSLGKKVMESQIKRQAVNIDSLKNQNKRFVKQIHQLEDSIENIETQLWLFFGIFSVVGIGSLWQYFSLISKKAKEEVATAIQQQLPPKASKQIMKELENHPVIVEYNLIKKLKEKSILIVSKKGKNKNFNEFLAGKGFSNVHNITTEEILQKESLQKDSFELVLFNNELGDMNQGEMNKIISKIEESAFHFLYFNTTHQSWKSDPLAGYSNSRERLEKNLVDALKK